MGHKYCGVVVEVGAEVKTAKPGQFVVGSLYLSDNTCANCTSGFQSSCVQREFMTGAQAPCARVLGATDIIEERGAEGIARILDMTDGVGAASVLECVGMGQSMEQAMGVCRPGGTIGYVGAPHGVSFDGQQPFFKRQRMLGGPAPVRRYLPDLMQRVLEGRIAPDMGFDLALPIAQVAEGYKAMDERHAIKTMSRVDRVCCRHRRYRAWV